MLTQERQKRKNISGSKITGIFKGEKGERGKREKRGEGGKKGRNKR